MLTALAATLLLAQGAEPNLVVANGTAFQTFDPDVASVSIRGEATDADRETARSESVAVLARAKAAAQRVVMDVSAYATPSTTVNDNSTQGAFGGYPGQPAPAQPAVRGFSAESKIVVRPVTITQVEPLVKAVQTVDGATASVYDYALKDPVPARRAVLRAAFLDARRQAQEVAEAASLHLGSVAFLDAGRGVSLSYRQVEKKVVGVANVAVRFRLVP